MTKLFLLILILVATTIILLEIILRKSEKLNLIADSKDLRASDEKQRKEVTDLTESLKTLELQHGHVNQLHISQVSFSSQSLNFVDGWRLTTHPPIDPNSNIFVFGGSTIQCLEVSDQFTICSVLQRTVNQNGMLARVHNRGVSGMTVKASFDLLTSTQISAKDCIVFYFGVNDSKLDTYLQKAIAPFSLIPGYIKILGGLRILLKLRIAEWLWLETVKPADRTVVNARANATKVAKTLQEARDYVTNNGAMFFAILQPNIFTKKNYTIQDHEISKRSKINPRIVKLQYLEYLNVLNGKNWFRQLTDAIDQHEKSPYLDWNHLDQSGNEIIANKIFKLIETELVPKQR